MRVREFERRNTGYSQRGESDSVSAKAKTANGMMPPANEKAESPATIRRVLQLLEQLHQSPKDDRNSSGQHRLMSPPEEGWQELNEERKGDKSEIR